MTNGLRLRDPATLEVVYDTQAEHTLFYIDELTISAADALQGARFVFPGYAGQKLVAQLYSPSPFSGNVDNLFQVQSCRVSYPGGVPTIDVFFEGSVSGYDQAIVLADGYLLVSWTGAPQ